jgi:O-antigen/teichoic acid export membrane protein
MSEDFASVKAAMARGAAWMVAMRWSLRAVGVVNTMIIARMLTPADFGIATMAWIVVEFLLTLSDANVDMALLRENAGSREHLDTAWTIRVVSGAATAAVLFAVAPLAEAYYADPRVSTVVWITALRAVVMGFENIGVVEFRRNLEFGKEYRYWLWRRLLMLGMGLALVAMFRDYMALAIAAPVSALITVAVSFAMSPYRPRPCLVHWRRLWAFSQWSIVYNTARFVNGRIDQFVIGGTAGAADTGSYYVAYDTATLPTREVIWPMGRAFTPTLARIVHDGAEMAKALRSILGFVLVIALPAGIGASLVAGDITVVLLGEQWAASAGCFRWLAVCGACESVLLAMESYFIARGGERLFTAITLAQLALLVPAVVLAGSHGVEVIAAMRTLVTGIAVAGMFQVMVGRGWLKWRDLAELAWRPLLAAAAMVAAVQAFHADGGSRLLSLLTDAAVGGAIYALALVALWGLSGRPEGAERSILAVLRRATT